MTAAPKHPGPITSTEHPGFLRLASRGAPRPALARLRAVAARASLANCQLCAHHCGVNRLAGGRGRCLAGSETRFFSAQVEAGDELELVPTFAVSLSGCDLRCDFCITGAASWAPRVGAVLDTVTLAAQARRALNSGARTIQILGGEPTIHLPAVLEFVAACPADAKLVWKTNAHASAQARQWLDGMFDVWVADFKFGNEACAQRLGGVRDYLSIVERNLIWAEAHAELIVRHLLMPGHLDCCWVPVARWLAAELPGVKVSLRAGFWPAWRAARHPELRRTAPSDEITRAFEFAKALDLNLIP